MGGSPGWRTLSMLASASEERRLLYICSSLKLPSLSGGLSCTRLLSAGEEFALAPSASWYHLNFCAVPDLLAPALLLFPSRLPAFL